MSAKQFSGERGIELPNESWYAFSRPGSAKSTCSIERPGSAGSSGSGHSSAIIAHVRPKLQNVSEEPQTTKNEKATEPAKPEADPKKIPPPLPPRGGSTNSNGSLKKLYQIDGKSPATETRVNDIVKDLPTSVLSRPGTPGSWAFDEKEKSLQTRPPRPNSATMCSPPVPRKVPISVDHYLRK